MNVNELYDFANWLRKQTEFIRPKYEAVHRLLQHNATQANKQPLEEPLAELDKGITSVPFNQLNSEQVRLLSAYGIDNYFGRKAQAFVAGTITKSNFDPATAATNFQSAIEALQKASERAASLVAAFDGIEDWTGGDLPPDEDFVQVRVEFRDEAAITNMVEWKQWAAKWYDIARGIGMAAGEAPENVRILGATKGSIVLTLATTYSVALILGGIFKVITKRASELLKLAHSMEDLKRKQLLNKELESAFKKRSDEIKSGGTSEAIAEVNRLATAEKNGELDKVIEKAVKELFDFGTRGGDLDFVSPEPPEPDAEGDAGDSVRLSKDIRELIEEIRSYKEEAKLLPYSDSSAGDGENAV